ncbi:DUF6053 domain-containing protein [Lysobacter enzymogenes]|uniref:DUF6053 domain-containing protein n=1 Tax=Lysobacter enzymogenes TaxID=69 RepID=UPI003748A93B
MSVRGIAFVVVAAIRNKRVGPEGPPARAQRRAVAVAGPSRLRGRPRPRRFSALVGGA